MFHSPFTWTTSCYVPSLLFPNLFAASLVLYSWIILCANVYMKVTRAQRAALFTYYSACNKRLLGRVDLLDLYYKQKVIVGHLMWNTIYYCVCNKMHCNIKIRLMPHLKYSTRSAICKFIKTLKVSLFLYYVSDLFIWMKGKTQNNIMSNAKLYRGWISFTYFRELVEWNQGRSCWNDLLSGFNNLQDAAFEAQRTRNLPLQ